MTTKTLSFLLLLTASIIPLQNSFADYADDVEISNKRADGESFAIAQGHYARARHMLARAVQEYDKGVGSVNPDVLLDIHAWRNTVLDRMEDLERILTLQPTANEQGVEFTPESRFINDEYLKVEELTKYGTPILEAKGQTLKIAVKHYTQSHDLLYSAVREFDLGLRIANPQQLFEVHEWRNTVIDLAKDLEKVIAPKARESETGVRYSPDSRLLNKSIQ